MAKIVCKVSWTGGKVVKTYSVLEVGSHDYVEVVTTDSQPFIIECPDEKVAERLHLEPAKGTDPAAHLYQVPPAPTKPVVVPNKITLKCGTLGPDGKFKEWSTGFGFPNGDD